MRLMAVERMLSLVTPRGGEGETSDCIDVCIWSRELVTAWLSCERGLTGERGRTTGADGAVVDMVAKRRGRLEEE